MVQDLGSQAIMKLFCTIFDFVHRNPTIFNIIKYGASSGVSSEAAAVSVDT